jgi:hypothetical protein
MNKLAIDLFCGLGGWTDGLLAEGWDVIGFDIEQHVYGEHRYPAQLVIQDVLTLHGSQFRNVDLIVASPPCQAYSYRAMPWSRAKALPPPDNSLFDACFRIQREACEAAGRRIPLIVENVRGAQKWVGRSRWNFGSFHLWGDVPALMPMTRKSWIGMEHQQAGLSAGDIGSRDMCMIGSKNNGGLWFNIGSPGQKVTNKNPVHELTFEQKTEIRGDQESGTKHAVSGHDWYRTGAGSRGGQARKAASALIAKIPLPLSRYVARTFA